MERYQLRFVVCILCIILQCNMSIQGLIKANNNCNTVEIRIPVSSISNRNSPPQNQQYGTNYPYTYFTQLSQYYANICNSCKGFLCNNKCNNNNAINLKSPSNTLSLSVPSISNAGRLTFIIDNRSAAKPAPDTTTPAINNGENNIDVIVKVVPIDVDSMNGTAYTSAQSSAKHNKYGNQITALTTAQELDSNSTKDYEISVYVKDVDNGTSPLKTSLQSQIIAENADGDVLVSKTKSNIVKTATDGDDTTVTGATLPPSEPALDTSAGTPVPPPAAAPPVYVQPPVSRPVAAPPVAAPPAAVPPAAAPPADVPLPEAPPADVPQPEAPPAEPIDSVAAESTSTAAAVTD